MDNCLSISGRGQIRVASFSKIYLCPAFSTRHFWGVVWSDFYDCIAHVFWGGQAPQSPSKHPKQKRTIFHLFLWVRFPEPRLKNGGLGPHQRSTCPLRFTRGLTPSYTIAGRYGRLILLSTKALGSVMSSTSTPSPAPARSPPPHRVWITAFPSSPRGPRCPRCSRARWRGLQRGPWLISVATPTLSAFHTTSKEILLEITINSSAFIFMVLSGGEIEFLFQSRTVGSYRLACFYMVGLCLRESNFHLR